MRASAYLQDICCGCASKAVEVPSRELLMGRVYVNEVVRDATPLTGQDLQKLLTSEAILDHALDKALLRDDRNFTLSEPTSSPL